MSTRNSHFRRTGSLRPRRTNFDLSYEKKLTCDMGMLVPILCEEAVPHDTWRIGNEIVVRMQPMVAPILHEITVYTHYFFVPYRLLWDRWEKFITGGKNGDNSDVLPRYNLDHGGYGPNSLWDYLGFPVSGWSPVTSPSPNIPLDFPRRAYNFIWDEYYRDQNLQSPQNPDPEDPDGEPTQPPNSWGPNWRILMRNWAKDYRTSALLDRQRGTAPALPISGETNAVWSSNVINQFSQSGSPLILNRSGSPVPGNVGGNDVFGEATLSYAGSGGTHGALTTPMLSLNNNTVSFDNASTFDVSDLRLSFQIQKWMERNMRAGIRYTEFLRSHFGVSPSDTRLDRPEYMGGSRAPIIVSEVLQTSETTNNSPQATMCGHGIVASGGYIDTYHVEEYGLIMGIMSIMPRPCYEDGINRQWLRRSRFDFYFPEFAHLSEQAIFNVEVFPQGGNPLDGDGNPVVGGDLDIWGYQAVYDEMRVKNDMVVAEMRSSQPVGWPSLSHWHLSRFFDGLPNLNSDFITCNPDKRIFAVQNTHGFIVNVANNIRATRPLPPIGEPGLIDHF